jgi:hypothetical protein
MSNYEMHIGKIDRSVFAIGENAKAEGNFGHGDRDDMTEALKELLDIVGKYTDSAAQEVLELARAASREMSADKPEKAVFQRLVDVTRKMMDKLSSSVIEVGALADAVAKISEMIHHL